MAKTHYKLTYFDMTGRGEVTRQLFVVAGLDFEDVRIKGPEWKALKPSTPYGSLPILEFDGKTICQSNTIARFVANTLGLAGKTVFEKVEADMIVDCIEDILQPLNNFFNEKDPAKQEVILQTYVSGGLQVFLAKLEKLLEGNRNGEGFFVGDSLTWADLTFTNACSWLDDLKVGDTINKYPKLSALKLRVNSQPGIAQWIKKHADSHLFHPE